jgi:hypothetical protein
VTAIEHNDPPTFLPLTAPRGREDLPLQLPFSAIDPEAGTLVYRLIAGPAGAAINAQTGLVTWTPGESHGGQQVSFRVQVTDDGTPALSAETTVVVTVDEVNSPPSLPPIADRVIQVGQPLRIVMGGADRDLPAEQLTYSLGNGTPSGASLDRTTGEFTWTPDLTQLGTHSIPLFVVDSGTPPRSGSLLLQVTVQPANSPPTSLELDGLEVAENAAGAVVGAVRVIDTDVNDSHAYAVSDERFEVSSGSLKLKSGERLDFETTVGINLSITATDAGGLAITRQFSLSVLDANDMPSTLSLSKSAVHEKVTGAVIGELRATDPDAGQTHAMATTDSRFEIIDGQLRLKPNAYLDFSLGATLVLDVVATDSGTPPQSASFALSLTVLANPRPWQNTVRPTDVNGDGSVSPLDALIIINLLNLPTSPLLSENLALPLARPATANTTFYDVNGDGFVAPVDVLVIINFLNDPLRGSEGEAPRPRMAPQGPLPIPLASSELPPPIATAERRVTSVSDSGERQLDDLYRQIGLAASADSARETHLLLAARALASRWDEFDDLIEAIADDVHRTHNPTRSSELQAMFSSLRSAAVGVGGDARLESRTRG